MKRFIAVAAMLMALVPPAAAQVLPDVIRVGMLGQGDYIHAYYIPAHGVDVTFGKLKAEELWGLPDRTGTAFVYTRSGAPVTMPRKMLAGAVIANGSESPVTVAGVNVPPGGAIVTAPWGTGYTALYCYVPEKPKGNVLSLLAYGLNIPGTVPATLRILTMHDGDTPADAVRLIEGPVTITRQRNDETRPSFLVPLPPGTTGVLLEVGNQGRTTGKGAGKPLPVVLAASLEEHGDDGLPPPDINLRRD